MHTPIHILHHCINHFICNHISKDKMISHATLASSFVLVTFFSIWLHVILNSPISSPLPLSLPSSNFTHNNLLQTVEKLGEGKLVGPEDSCIGPNGLLYSATRDGWIKRMKLDGSDLEDWKFIGGPSVLGISPSLDGSLLVCDADKGLLKVSEEGFTILASYTDDGSIIRLADKAIEASDGTIYFTDASSKFKLSEWILDVLEARPHGRLLKYDPSTKNTSIVLSDLAFANGVALSSNGNYLLVCETWRFRCLKHWLKGEYKGKTEIFVDNLPGGPDNINLAPDGSYWIALLQMKSGLLEHLIHKSSIAKRTIAAFPKLLKIMKPTMKGGMVVKVAENGMILSTLDDSDGRVMSFVTSCLEYEGFLYLGSLATNFIAKLPLQHT